MEKVKTADSFGTFLETLRKRRAAAPPDAGAAATRLLQLIAERGDDVPGLMARSGLDAKTFMSAFSDLSDMRLIELSGPPGREQVGLTEAGREVVAQAPATD